MKIETVAILEISRAPRLTDGCCALSSMTRRGLRSAHAATIASGLQWIGCARCPSERWMEILRLLYEPKREPRRIPPRIVRHRCSSARAHFCRQRSRRLDKEISKVAARCGIDSLSRTELVLRVERSFRLKPPAAATSKVETVGDLLLVLEQARPGAEAAPQTIAKPILPAVQAAVEAGTLVEVLDWHASRHPDRLHLTVLEDDAPTPAVMTYRGLRPRVKRRKA